MRIIYFRGLSLIILIMFLSTLSSAACNPHGPLTINGVNAQEGTVVRGYFDAGKGETFCGSGIYSTETNEWSLSCEGGEAESTMSFYVDYDPTIVLEGNILWEDETSPIISLEAPNSAPKIEEYTKTIEYDTYGYMEEVWVSAIVSDPDHGEESQDKLKLILCDLEGIENNTGCTNRTYCVSNLIKETNLTCTFNLNLSAGDYNYTINVMDEHGLVGVGETIFNLSVDAIGPTIVFENITSGNVNQDWIYVNLTSPDEGFQNLTIYLYNSSSLINTQSATYQPFSYNFTNLTNGTYYINVTSFDNYDNPNSTNTVIAYLGEYCGNLVCSSIENCSICVVDCGECTEDSSPPTEEKKSSSSGGGSSCVYDKNFDWECTSWSECNFGIQTRTCKDKNNCGNGYGRPILKKQCSLKKEITVVPEDLFDIKLDLNERRIYNSTDLIAMVSYENFGSTPTNLNWSFEIYSEDNNLIYSKKGEVIVETEKFQKINFKDLNLSTGKYNLVYKIDYGKNVHDEFDEFFYVGEEYVISPVFSYFIDEEGKYLIFVFVLGFLSALVKYCWIKYFYRIKDFYLKRKFYQKLSQRYIIKKEPGDY